MVRFDPTKEIRRWREVRLGEPSAIALKEALNTELQQLEALTQILAELGSPSKKQPGESTEDYADRVNTTMKARGMAIHLMHQQL